jgi:hypothetical protein
MDWARQVVAYLFYGKPVEESGDAARMRQSRVVRVLGTNFYGIEQN